MRFRSIHRAAGLVLAMLVWSTLRPTEAGGQHVPAETAASSPAEWADLEEALQQSQTLGRPVFVYVHASWCAPCHRLEREVFPHLESELASIITAGVDLSDRPDPGYRDVAHQWSRANGLDTPPAFALVSTDGEVVASLTGYHTAPQLRHFLSLGVDLAIGQ